MYPDRPSAVLGVREEKGSMKLAMFAVSAALMFVSPVLAQDGAPTPGQGQGRQEGRGRGMRGGLPVGPLTDELGLTPEQVAAAEKISEELRAKMRELFESGDREGMREKMQALTEEGFAKLEPLLTPEQKEKAKAFREQLQQRMQRGPGGDRGGPGGRGERRVRLREEALKALALADEEAAVVTPLLDATLTKRETASIDTDTSRRQLQQKLGETTDPEAVTKLVADFRAARQAARAELEAAQEQLREVLTVEQEAKLVGLGVLE